MKKILSILILALFVVSIVGCTISETPTSEVEATEEDIEADISEIDALEEDLDMAELDELDALMEELESD
ncbi:hypothetical protein GOV03_04135 [Candidatus Woesearchaeota archaeon]|nr:hypothetical protein [Candidatus Woesearchaeota archaeon]